MPHLDAGDSTPRAAATGGGLLTGSSPGSPTADPQVEAPPGSAAPQSQRPPPRSVHTVDWATLQAIRAGLRRRARLAAVAAAAAAGAELSPVPSSPRSPRAGSKAANAARAKGPTPIEGFEGDRVTTARELFECWVEVVSAEQLRHCGAALTTRDREFIDIRVSQSMREVDPQCSGQVDIDTWVHHMLLTRSSPPAMRAMLQLNRLLEAALTACPGILVGLQHAFEVAREAATPQEEGGHAPSASSSSTALPFSEVVGIFGRKLWHLRPGTKDCPAKRRSDFSYRSPEEFVRNTCKALELEDGSCVTAADFLGLCLGRREWEVTLHLYDLSRGVAAALSPWLLEEQLEGVWHTGLVVYGKEYYFGGDIYYDTPGETGFGRPRIAISLGSTLRQRDELHAFVVTSSSPTSRGRPTTPRGITATISQTASACISLAGIFQRKCCGSPS